MKKDTLLTISERTGYSISTVSRVLSGKGKNYRISQQTIDYITEVARSCNYTPNLIAQSLRTRKTNTIGLTIPNIDNPFFATLSGVIINKFKSKGYNVILSDTMENVDNEIEALNSFTSRNVDGIIAVPVSSNPQYMEDISRTIPVILIDRYFENTTLPYVCTDNYFGAYTAAEHLVARGYRHLLAIQGLQESTPNKERLRGFRQAVENNRDIMKLWRLFSPIIARTLSLHSATRSSWAPSRRYVILGCVFRMMWLSYPLTTTVFWISWILP